MHSAESRLLFFNLKAIFFFAGFSAVFVWALEAASVNKKRQIAKMILFMVVNFWFNNLFQQRWGQWRAAVAANDDMIPDRLVSID